MAAETIIALLISGGGLVFTIFLVIVRGTMRSRVSDVETRVEKLEENMRALPAAQSPIACQEEMRRLETRVLDSAKALTAPIQTELAKANDLLTKLLERVAARDEGSAQAFLDFRARFERLERRVDDWARNSA